MNVAEMQKRLLAINEEIKTCESKGFRPIPALTPEVILDRITEANEIFKRIQSLCDEMADASNFTPTARVKELSQKMYAVLAIMDVVIMEIRNEGTKRIITCENLRKQNRNKLRLIVIGIVVAFCGAIGYLLGK